MTNAKLASIWTVAIFTVGMAAGWGIDRSVMNGRIDKLTAAHTEQLRQREVQRGNDERAAREKEQQLAQRAGQIEQEKNDAIERTTADAAALIARLRKQAASKPTCSGGVSETATPGEDATWRVILDRSREDTVRLAERAEKQRAELAKCYAAYDSVGR